MFDYDEIEEVDPSPAAVRLNFEIDDKAFPVSAATEKRLPHRTGAQRQAVSAAAGGGGGVLRMFLARDYVTPDELVSIWEQEWQVSYASRIRFLAPPDALFQYLHPREDFIPMHPAVTRLEAPASILVALAHELRLRDPLGEEGGPPCAGKPAPGGAPGPPRLPAGVLEPAAGLQARPLNLQAEAAAVGPLRRQRRSRLGGGEGGDLALGEQPVGATAGDAEGATFKQGDKVRLRGITTRPELNGEVGTVVAHVDGRWRVQMHGASLAGRDKLLRIENLEKLIASPKPGFGRGHAASPTSCCYVGASTSSAPREMIWDSNRSCYQINLDLRGGNLESFQIWFDGDPARCIYPGQDMASASISPMGPDSHDRGRRWTIGDRGDGVCEEGSYEVCLYVKNPGSAPSRVAWARLGRIWPAMQSTQVTAATSSAPSVAERAKQEQVLPAQEFEVVHETLHVRAKAASDSAVLDVKTTGEHFFGVRETFDGWIKVDAAPGWVLKDMCGRNGVGATVRPVGKTPLLAVTDVSEETGPQRFRVEAESPVQVYVAPGREAKLQGSKKRGEEFMANAQTYNGWVKLTDRGGWVLAFDIDGDRAPLLRCASLEEEIGLRKATEAALRGEGDEDDASLGEAARSRRARLRRGLCSATEFQLLEAQEQAEALRGRIARALATSGGGERRVELQQCLEACLAQGLQEEARQVQRALDKMLQQEQSHQDAHAPLLAALAAAASSGDAQAMREARDAAKQGGVSAKVIARTVALHSG